MSDELNQLDEKATRPTDKSVGDSATSTDKVKEEPVQAKEPSTNNKRNADKDTGEKSSDSVNVSEPQAGREAGAKHDKVRDSFVDKDEVKSTETNLDKYESEEVSAVEAAKAKLQEKVEFKIDISEDLGTLFESADLDEEFVSKAKTIFETAINEAAKGHIGSIQEAAEELFEAAIQEHCEELDQVVDKYASFAVNEWAEDNRLALEAGIMVEQAKSLFAGMKELMAEHNLELDEDDVSSYESSLEKAKELEEGLDAQIDKNIELAEELASAKKELEVERFVSGMVETQAEKIRGLAEELDFDSAETFRDKLGVLKENYFPTDAKASGEDMITEDAEGDVVVEEDRSKVVDHSVPAYIRDAAAFMSKINRK